VLPWENSHPDVSPTSPQRLRPDLARFCWTSFTATGRGPSTCDAISWQSMLEMGSLRLEYSATRRLTFSHEAYRVKGGGLWFSTSSDGF